MVYTAITAVNDIVVMHEEGVEVGSLVLANEFRPGDEPPVSSVCADYIARARTVVGLIVSLSVPLPVATKEGVSTGPAAVI